MDSANDGQNNMCQSNKTILKPLNPNKTQKKRCFYCKKKSMIITLCKCENHFCLKHKLPEQHNCSYDFKLNKIMLEPVHFKKVEII